MVSTSYAPVLCKKCKDTQVIKDPVLMRIVPCNECVPKELADSFMRSLYQDDPWEKHYKTK